MSNGKMFEVGSVTLSQIQFFYMTYCIFLQVFSYPEKIHNKIHLKFI